MTKRTPAQAEANRIDLELFRLAVALDRFAREYKAARMFEAAGAVRSARIAIRACMHAEDVRATS